MTHLSDIRAPPHASFLLKNPDFINAACQGCEPKPVECPPTILFEREKCSPQPEKHTLFCDFCLDIKRGVKIIYGKEILAREKVYFREYVINNVKL